MSSFKLPKPVDSKEIVYENFQEGIERFYFWIIDFVENTLKYEITKTEDSFLTSVGSAQWGLLEQRKGLQQDKAAQFLANIGGMIKSMMQLYKELTIIDERLGYYEEASKGNQSAERSLKSLWVDLVEGGGKNPTSVIGLAQQVGFVTLPDLFFNINPKNKRDIDGLVEKVETNKQLKMVLGRKLHQYIEWKERTKSEIDTRRHFSIKYLAQHFSVIKMYLDWVKPYLKNIKKLEQEGGKPSHELLEGSEGSVTDIEVLCTRKIKGRLDGKLRNFEQAFPVLLLKFHHRTRPVTAFQNEYQKGAIHLGRVEMTFEAYGLTKKNVENYRKAKDLNAFEMLSSIDSSMKALLEHEDSRKDFEGYLKEARDIKEEKTKKKKSVFKGFGSLVPKISVRSKKTKVSKTAQKKIRKITSTEKKISKQLSKADLSTLYDTFKIKHGMITET
tara:strand:+ start:3490 stop:4821 length:1332 start_codon:yes stop_codon:yes gene_type:complete